MLKANNFVITHSISTQQRAMAHIIALLFELGCMVQENQTAPSFSLLAGNTDGAAESGEVQGEQAAPAI